MIKRRLRRVVILLFGDVLVLASSFYLAIFLRNVFRPLNDPTSLLWIFIPLSALWIVVFYTFGLYDQRQLIFTRRLTPLLLSAQLINTALATAYFYLNPGIGETPKTILFLILGFSLLGTWFWRKISIGLPFMRSGRRLLFVSEEDGSTDVMLKHLESAPWSGSSSVIIVEPKNKRSGVHKEILEHVYSNDVGYVIVAMSSIRGQRLFSGLHQLWFSDVTFFDYDELYEELTATLRLDNIQPQAIAQKLIKPGYEHAKRLIDIFMASLILVVLAIPGVFLFIKYRQYRERHEYLGHYNYSFRLNHYPSQFLNLIVKFTHVFRGNFALVGPAAHTLETARRFNRDTRYTLRYLIRPGLLGWDELFVGHRFENISPEEALRRLPYDLYYVKNRSFTLDTKLAFRLMFTR